MLLVNVVHRFVTGPESMVDYYVSEYRVPRKRCLLLYNDIDLSTRVPLCAESRGRVRRDRSLADDTVYVLFVGRVSNLKGGRPLLEVAERLGEAPPCSLCRILVVGEIHLSDVGRRLESLTTVDVLGSMSNEEAFRYFQAADVFVLPSLSEGFPRVVLEAMAAGLPIASFDVGGVRDILGEMQQQFVVPWGDTGALADAVRALVDHRNLREELGQENLRLVRRFDTAVVAEMFVRAIGGEA
jgi:glycosyltransferase involved in cell wall biosynthesis